MAYSIHYQISYYRKSGGQTTINILEKDYIEDSSGGITHLLAAEDPLEISFEGDVNNIYKPTIGSGATIKIMATPLSLEDLFTTDPQKFMVKIYNGNDEDSSEANNLVWQGFVNTGIYTQSYSTPISLRSPITIYCNDGMILLEDLPYTQTVGGSDYIGYSTVGAVMKNIFDKLELEFLTIRTATDLEYDGHTNLFTCLSVNNENYYDEEGLAMSCREVLESIFRGLGLIVSLKGLIIYVIDPIHLHLSELDAKEYDTHPIFGSNESITGFGGYLDITDGFISWYQTGQVRDIILSFNYIDITYDPYNFTERGYDFNEEGNAGNTGTYGEYTNNGVTYRVHIDITMLDWTISGTPYFEGFEEMDPDVIAVDYVIRQQTGGTGTFAYIFPFSNIQQDDNLMLELSMDIFVNTRHESNIFDPAELSTLIQEVDFANIQIKIGGYWYNWIYQKWQDTIAYCKLIVRQYDLERIEGYYTYNRWWTAKPKYYAPIDASIINDTWASAILRIPIASSVVDGGGLLNGSISVIIPKEMSFTDVYPEGEDNNILNILIKNVNVQIVDLKKNPITNDGVLSNAVISSATSMKKSKLDIQLKNGIGSFNFRSNGVAKGAFVSNEAPIAGAVVTGLSRADSVEYTTNKLLLQSLMGQYAEQRFKLTGQLNVKDYIADINFYLIKDSGHMGTKAFYIVSGTYQDREESMKVEMIELTDTRGVIV
jgi:hypothetical protein